MAVDGEHKEVDMPRGDRTGPDGMGPMTVRAAGFCSGNGVPGYVNPQGGRGLGYGRGIGYGRGYSYGAGFGRGMGRGMARAYTPGWHRGYAYNAPLPATPEAEKQELEREASFMEEELKAIRKRLDELGTKSAD